MLRLNMSSSLHRLGIPADINWQLQHLANCRQPGMRLVHWACSMKPQHQTWSPAMFACSDEASLAGTQDAISELSSQAQQMGPSYMCWSSLWCQLPD